MNKKTILSIVLYLIFPIVFNIVFFVAGDFEHPVSVWISYGFIHFSYLTIPIAPLLIRQSRSVPILKNTLFHISTVYFLIELGTGLIAFLIRSESYRALVIVQVLITGVYGALLLVNIIANQNTMDNIGRRDAEAAFLKNAASQVLSLIGKSTDKKADKEVERVYDLLHASPTKSVAAVKTIEADILGKIADLESAVGTDSAEKTIAVSGELITLLEERNRKLKISN